MTREKCLMYAAGPGDIVKTFQAWNAGEDDPHQVSVTYSGQFFQLCRELGVKGVAISSNPRVDVLHSEQFVVENRPKCGHLSGLRYHLQQISYAKGLIQTARKETADVLIAAESTGHFFGLSWYAPRNLFLIPTIHCTLWPMFRPLDSKQGLMNALNRNLFSARAPGILCISEEIQRQLQRICGAHLQPVYRFLPSYRREVFQKISLPCHPLQPMSHGGPFHILFAGRLERNKGIFDLFEMCLRLQQKFARKVIWDIAGDGSLEDELRKMVRERGVEDIFRVHGYCQRQKMLELIQRSHAFIVPTRTEFEEGFNKVVAESILNNRPVLTSAVCPAIDDVRPAVVEARPNSVDDYCQGIERLVEERAFYEEKLAACLRLQEQFYDPARSWRAQLKRVVEDIL